MKEFAKKHTKKVKNSWKSAPKRHAKRTTFVICAVILGWRLASLSLRDITCKKTHASRLDRRS